MREGISLDPDGVGLADEPGVGEHSAVDEADIGQAGLDLLVPGVVAAENHDVGLGGVREFYFSSGGFRGIILVEVTAFCLKSAELLVKFFHRTDCLSCLPIRRVYRRTFSTAAT